LQRLLAPPGPLRHSGVTVVLQDWQAFPIDGSGAFWIDRRELFQPKNPLFFPYLVDSFVGFVRERVLGALVVTSRAVRAGHVIVIEATRTAAGLVVGAILADIWHGLEGAI